MTTTRTVKVIPATPQRTYTEPARAAREEIIETTTCDCCGKPWTRNRQLKKCMCCGRDVCGACSVNDPDAHGDYPSWLCDHCRTLHNSKYKAMLHKLEQQYDDERLSIETDWKAESLAVEPTEAKP